MTDAPEAPPAAADPAELQRERDDYKDRWLRKSAEFDPNVHQAVVHEESADHREGEVIGELRTGYTINDRLLRLAMVKVAKARQ